MATFGINSNFQTSQYNQSVKLSNASATKHVEQPPRQEIASVQHRYPEREFDFTNMTLAEQSNAAKTLYDKGVLSMGEMAFMTGRYGLIEHDGQLGGTTLKQANSERFDVIANMKENLATVQGQGQATSDVVSNYKALISKLEAYQFGLNTSA
ncbi:hypothetical protein PSECIP111854_01089 [Pseudoalteromonas sp. CIP111854]|uniref:Uncharacterized protein n=1 Tax=Pseudoalteromonas holothuriae TaxID=2963714 RepID=A0A9W4W1Z1_9GAMM|nr:hypothetical protein [Pseudoalteromonas sp. CIP111854]CAH9053029.1 hypothetical protein PSECIP111854_01089 [Pseudoalteromonas sp. CIP111854]